MRSAYTEKIECLSQYQYSDYTLNERRESQSIGFTAKHQIKIKIKNFSYYYIFHMNCQYSILVNVYDIFPK